MKEEGAEPKVASDIGAISVDEVVHDTLNGGVGEAAKHNEDEGGSEVD